MKKTSKTKFENMSKRALLDIADDHLMRGEYVIAQTLAAEILAHNKKLSTADESYALCIIGYCYWQTAHHDEALTYLHNAFALAETASDPALQCKALHGIAHVQINSGDFNAALVTAKQALAFAEKAEDKKKVPSCLTAIGLVYMELGDYPPA